MGTYRYECTKCGSEVFEEGAEPDRCYVCEPSNEELEYNVIAGIISRRLGSRFMDPPDGGDVTVSEQVDRLVTALKNAEHSLSPNTSISTQR